MAHDGERIKALEDENRKLQFLLQRSKLTIERLTRMLQDAGIPLQHQVSSDSGELQFSNVASNVYNSHGQLLFSLYLDTPHDEEEFSSWFSPFLGNLPQDRVSLVTKNLWTPIRQLIFEVDQLTDVTVSVRPQKSAKHRLWVAQFLEKHERDGSTFTIQPASPQAQLAAPLQAMLGSAVMIQVASFLPLVDLFATFATCQSVFNNLVRDNALFLFQSRRFADPHCRLENICLVYPTVLPTRTVMLDRCDNGFRVIEQSMHCLRGDATPRLPPSVLLTACVQMEQFSYRVANELRCDFPLAEVRNSDFTFESLRPGCQLDVLDTVNKWYDATVIAKMPESRTVSVHFNKWSNNWDELIAFDTQRHRFAPLGSKFDAAAARLKSTIRFFLYRSTTQPSEEDLHVIIVNTFANDSDVLPHIQNARVFVRDSALPQILSMVETNYIAVDNLNSFFRDRGGAQFWLVEMHGEGTVNGFLVAITHCGEGMIYARYGAPFWKH